MHPLEALLQKRIVIVDGAMGTTLQGFGLTEADFRGERFKDHHKDLKGNGDVLVLTRPDVIASIQRRFAVCRCLLPKASPASISCVVI